MTLSSISPNASKHWRFLAFWLSLCFGNCLLSLVCHCTAFLLSTRAMTTLGWLSNAHRWYGLETLRDGNPGFYFFILIIISRWAFGSQPSVVTARVLSKTTSFPGYSLYFAKVPWLRLVTCLLDFSRFQRCDWREGLESYSLPPLSSPTELSSEWNL